MLNLEWYRTFKAIYEKGTLTAAAEALFISQPGVSLHLSSLENYVGVKLFDRVAKKMVPTERGKVLYNSIREPLNKLQQIEKEFQRSTEKHTPTLTIGMCFETYQNILEKHIHLFDFNIITRFSDYKELLADLNKGMVDVVITPHKGEAKGVEYIPFAKENIVLIASKDISKKEFDGIRRQNDTQLVLQWLKTHKWYGTASDNEHFKRFWQLNFDQSPDFRQNYIVPNFNSIIRSLSRGSGLAIVPDFLCTEQLQSKQLQILWNGHRKITNQLYFAFRKNTIYKNEILSVLEIFQREFT
ncbi:LysR family transcriptional regulator [Carboxylicivirga sp. RSCT41]|uniref:LysR family transcriptional regulator n=1 Tax=Carboxylicivirga agarovorans TaxID=3417570 RepID=UPI003D33AFA0